MHCFDFLASLNYFIVVQCHCQYQSLINNNLLEFIIIKLMVSIHMMSCMAVLLQSTLCKCTSGSVYCIGYFLSLLS